MIPADAWHCNCDRDALRTRISKIGATIQLETRFYLLAGSGENLRVTIDYIGNLIIQQRFASSSEKIFFTIAELAGKPVNSLTHSGYYEFMKRSIGTAENKNWIQRHSINARISHWIVVISFAYLLVSGVHIFLDFPELYWGKVGFQGHPAFFKLSDWGISWDEAGAIGDRRWGRNYHFLFAWVFVINGIIYLALNLWKKGFYQKMFPHRDELRLQQLKAETSNHLHFRLPKGDAARHYNSLQKLSYLIVLFVLFPFMIASGLAQMPAFSAIAPDLIDLFGGRQTARTLHVLATLLLMLFVIVHLIEVFIAGAVNGIRSMIIGKYVLPEEED